MSWDIFTLKEVLDQIEYKPEYKFYCSEQHSNLWMWLEVDLGTYDSERDAPNVYKSSRVTVSLDTSKRAVLYQAYNFIYEYIDYTVPKEFKYLGTAIYDEAETAVVTEVELTPSIWAQLEKIRRDTVNSTGKEPEAFILGVNKYNEVRNDLQAMKRFNDQGLELYQWCGIPIELDLETESNEIWVKQPSRSQAW